MSVLRMTRPVATTTLTVRQALGLVVPLGIGSLFADMTYEGARSIAGPFLASLGGSGLVVGVVGGPGELMGYTLRLWSGLMVDRTRRYWIMSARRAYGLFNMYFGVAWFAGSKLMGRLYDVSIPALITCSVGGQSAAVPLFVIAHRLSCRRAASR